MSAQVSRLPDAALPSMPLCLGSLPSLASGFGLLPEGIPSNITVFLPTNDAVDALLGTIPFPVSTQRAVCAGGTVAQARMETASDRLHCCRRLACYQTACLRPLAPLCRASPLRTWSRRQRAFPWSSTGCDPSVAAPARHLCSCPWPSPADFLTHS